MIRQTNESPRRIKRDTSNISLIRNSVSVSVINFYFGLRGTRGKTRRKRSKKKRKIRKGSILCGRVGTRDMKISTARNLLRGYVSKCGRLRSLCCRKVETTSAYMWLSRRSAFYCDPQKAKYTTRRSIAKQGHAFVRGQSIDCPLACPLDFLDGSVRHCASKNPLPPAGEIATPRLYTPLSHARNLHFVVSLLIARRNTRNISPSQEKYDQVN